MRDKSWPKEDEDKGYAGESGEKKPLRSDYIMIKTISVSV